MFNRNTILPMTVIVISVVLLFLINDFDLPLYRDASVGAQFFPTMIAIIQIILCIVLIAKDRMNKEPAEETSSKPIFSKLALYGIIFLLSYALIMQVFGYLIASLVCFTAYLLFLKVKKVSYYVTAWVFVFSVYYIFGEVFFIMLPEGTMF
ncbi:tripartite tricarboxylate transporter TctB family protein [Vibrio sp. RC27]